MIKLGIAIPTHGQWVASFGTSLSLMTAEIVSDPPSNPFNYFLSAETSSMLPTQRTSLAKEMIRNDCTHVLWLDTDMVFPAETARILLKHDKDIVGVNYSRKYPPFRPTALDMKGQYVYSDDEKTGLERVVHLGLGVCLMKTEVFKDLPDPWFPMVWSEERREYVGEDVFFCHWLQQHKKTEIWCDHDLSKRVQHVGTFEYTTHMSCLGRNEKD